MKHETFNGFLGFIFTKIDVVLGSKSLDYSDKDDKLYNFKLAARLDGITAIEALRGMQLKHRASLCQGLDDLQKGKVRSEKWWMEKCIDDMNYTILLLALLQEEYFE